MLAGYSSSCLCSHTPGSSPATACCLVLDGCSFSCTFGSSLATALCMVLAMFSHHRLLSCYCSLSGVGWLLMLSHPRLLSCYCLLSGVGVARILAPPVPLLLLLAVWCWRCEESLALVFRSHAVSEERCEESLMRSLL